MSSTNPPFPHLMGQTNSVAEMERFLLNPGMPWPVDKSGLTSGFVRAFYIPATDATKQHLEWVRDVLLTKWDIRHEVVPSRSGDRSSLIRVANGDTPFADRLQWARYMNDPDSWRALPIPTSGNKSRPALNLDLTRARREQAQYTIARLIAKNIIPAAAAGGFPDDPQVPAPRIVRVSEEGAIARMPIALPGLQRIQPWPPSPDPNSGPPVPMPGFRPGGPRTPKLNS